MFDEKEITIKHLDGTESKGINIKYSEGTIHLFKWYDDLISFNVFGVKGGAKVNSYISYDEIKRLRDWINTIFGMTDREKKDLELIEARQRIEELEQVLTEVKNRSWWRGLFKK